jgi:DNA-binding LacI/PurR family transcriptional regulator
MTAATKSLHAKPKTPKYLMLAQRFRKQIESGALKAGDRLPTFTEFRTRFGATPATVERVLMTLERDGLIERRPQSGIYVLEASQRGVQSGQSTPRKSTHNVIGCIWPDATEVAHLPYWSHLLHGFQEAVLHADAELQLLHPNSTRGWEKVDGVITHVQQIQSLESKIHAFGIPCVTVMDCAQSGLSVRADDRGGVEQAMEHLLSLGHRRIGYLIHAEKEVAPVEKERLTAYRHVLRRAGITPRKEWVHSLINWSEFVTRGRMSMEEWLSQGFESLGCTALLVQNDRAAVGAIETLRSRGIRVPQDLSVIGFDGTIECEMCQPRLTSVEVPLHQVGVKAVNLLLQQIKGEVKPHASIVLPTRLEVRASTAPPSQASH